MGDVIVSVIMPAFRCEQTIGNAIESILNQTMRDFELLVVFDHSEDNTRSIIESFAVKDARVRVIQNTAPSSTRFRLPEALNLGVAKARADLIARMDADDVAYPDRLEVQLAFLRNAQDVAFCGTGAVFVDSSDIELFRRIPVCKPRRARILAEYAPPLYHPTWLFRRSVFDAVGGYRQMAAEDYDLLLRVLDAGWEVDNCPIIGLRYRSSPSHRGSLISHKCANYAYDMHQRRRRGLADDFDVSTVLTVISPSTWARRERFGAWLISRGFELKKKNIITGAMFLFFGLLLTPASLRLSARKVVAQMMLFFDRVFMSSD